MTRSVLADAEAGHLLADGLQAIRRQFSVPEEFPPQVVAAAEEAAQRAIADGRADRRDIELVTLDPAGSTDLDQAFALHVEGDDVVLHYAIADVAFFVDRGSAIEAEAWKRGSTIYAPDRRASQYPEVLSQGAASLLPDQDRPSVLLTVAVAADGRATLRSAERAVVRSRAKLAYETAAGADLPPLLAELARRIEAAEDARGASRIEFPEQEIVADPSAPGGLVLRTRDRHPSEDENSALSLAANLAVADKMLVAKVGLFRVMAEPDDRDIVTLHHIAHALGVSWPSGATLRQLDGRLDPKNAKHAAFLMAARRAGGGATYASYQDGITPWHAAVAATYAHATAPLRRLADRYVLDLVVQLAAGAAPSADEVATFGRLPEVMERADTMGSRVEHAAIDLVESVELDGRVGEVFDATVTDNPGSGAMVQLADPPVRARVHLDHVQPGQHVLLRLVQADPAQRLVRFEPAQPTTLRT